ncbi:MAG: sugar phosphate isomerase/epimerase [Lentisphaeria bacterium]|nr:sugar phosphate isomerase/epimerase [Lentisphaeria bacterium]
MRLVMFSKMLKEKSPEELIRLAREWGLDGYDLCVRPGYPVSPENAAEELPRVVRLLRAEGLDIPMVTGNFDLLEPEHPTAEPLLHAMDLADVRLLKLGYFKYDPTKQDYQAEVSRVRSAFGRWQEASRRHNVRICYHTHSNRCMGLNAAGLAHLLEGFDPACLGAYLDPAHLVVEGEDIATALGMVRPWLSIVAVKDVLLRRVEKNGHGSVSRDWVVAGEGVVDWTQVFESLGKVGYGGPVSVHCEFRVAPEDFPGAAAREVAFFRRFVP